jgi:hypothetical protein
MNQSKHKQKIAEMNSPEWDEIMKQIEDTKNLIDHLRNKRDGMIRPNREAASKIKTERWNQDEQYLRMAKDGMSVTEIANATGCSKHTLPSKIWRIWNRRFTSHYRAHRRFSEMGLLTALRKSPPLE